MTSNHQFAGSLVPHFESQGTCGSDRNACPVISGWDAFFNGTGRTVDVFPQALFEFVFFFTKTQFLLVHDSSEPDLCQPNHTKQLFMGEPPDSSLGHAYLCNSNPRERDTPKKIDDGWPESVEEQSLLLLVWRHYIGRQYIKDVL